MQERIAKRRIIENEITTFKSKETLEAENDALWKQLSELKKIREMKDNPEWKKQA